MQGPPGSGKTVVAGELKDFLEHCNINTEIFSTDSFFCTDAGYKYDPTLLGAHREKNLAAACASKARVIVIDDSNLSPNDYAKYKANMLDRIVIVLSCKPKTPEELLHNARNVTLKQLEKMCEKYNPASPAYIGGFVSHTDLAQFVSEITQIQPSHLTEWFIGGNHRKLREFNFALLNKPYTFYITGISRTAAGVGLVCSADIHSESTPHITLSVNDGFKAVDVGRQINVDTMERFPEPIKLTAMRLPMF